MITQYYILRNRKTNQYLFHENDDLVDSIDDAGWWNIKGLAIMLSQPGDKDLNDYEIIPIHPK